MARVPPSDARASSHLAYELILPNIRSHPHPHPRSAPRKRCTLAPAPAQLFGLWAADMQPNSQKLPCRIQVAVVVIVTGLRIPVHLSARSAWT